MSTTPEPARAHGEGARAEAAAAVPAPRRGLPRPVEALLAGLGLVAAAPVVALAAAAVAAGSSGPVLFRQIRVGKGGKPFTLYKLRTMRSGAPGALVTAGSDPRITPVGRLLRRWKLDELPELWNVVRGDMSLVGPRPEVPRYVDLDDPRWRGVLAVRPGLTDPVTLTLRDEEGLLARATGDPERYYRRQLQPWKLRGSLDYLARRSWASDLGVLAATAWRLFRPAPPPGPDGPPAEERSHS